ncbi:tRNA 2-thiouridine(34) synthase MnmA [Patescibacteria group bacterium]|nr:tRNA 2-thiouridine(34) synthase MnmA [Patescibacteria group bacterium]MBU1016076.1 tRNA 2-thiouridine(34) synthase MnmA [Patescibacteria group bacterium]MBU1684906.1 tRNA 2-thiouridine(34) synthase MnmA [Patescibacteria group bacterium]MBU1938366.1 tRNA 2-thiouridine(34) synthase MnmA [Patescibacteria group bacterium]
MKIAVLTSGGVDSSVALRLLHREGHKLTAFYLKIWLEDELSYLGECPWEEDLAYVRQICDEIDVPLKVVPMQKEYWERVVEYTVAEAKAGRTPNPDVLCNRQIKFGQFYEVIDDSFEKVATGHYARAEETDKGFILRRAPDPVKDQTYFLAQISQKQLSRALFPIGKFVKGEVRALAREFNLPNQNRKDSQGICFLGKIPFADFLKHHLGEKPGEFVGLAGGKVVGEHRGYWFYTIGQRQGLGLSGGPWFVVKKDIGKNIIYLAQGHQPDEVYKSEFKVGPIHLINDRFPMTNLPAGRAGNQLKVKIRHGATMHDCRVDGNRIILKEPVHGVAAGQFAVFYYGDICLGSAVII